jgi:membrane fusion protein (multidrug efflux system)
MSTATEEKHEEQGLQKEAEGDANSKSKKQENSKDESTQEKKEQTPEEKAKRKRALLIFAAVLLVGIVGGVLYWLHARNYENTDDAQVDGNLSPIGTRIDGTVIKVYVENNQFVHKGDPLVDLDPEDNQVALDQAEANLQQARSQLNAQAPNVPITQVQNNSSIASAQTNVAGAIAAVAAAERDADQAAATALQQKAANDRAQTDFQRYQQLMDKEEVSKQQYDQYNSTAKQQAATLAADEAALLAAQRTVDQRRAQLLQAQSQLSQSQSTAKPQLLISRANVQEQEANIKSAEAQVEQARLNVGYTKITAPVDGIVMRRSAQVGARLSKGQQLLSISEISDLWITANFKETQLRRMRQGQHTKIHVDAVDRDFAGTVQAVGGATGSAASILPPENATGNYVKVVQRIPVRINFDPNQEGLSQLRPGMSAEPNVEISR